MAYPYLELSSEYTAEFPAAVMSALEVTNESLAGTAVVDESFSVPAVADGTGKYRMCLDMVPLDLPGITITVGAASRTLIPYGETVGAGEIAICMSTGIVEFNSADAGGAVLASYTGRCTSLLAYWHIRLQGELIAVQSRAALGPAADGSADNAIARWDGTTGRLLQDSGVTVGDTQTGQVLTSNTIDSNGHTVLSVAGDADTNLIVSIGDIDVEQAGYKTVVDTILGTIVTGPLEVNDNDGNPLVSISGKAADEDILIKFGDIDGIGTGALLTFDGAAGTFTSSSNISCYNIQVNAASTVPATRMMLTAGRAASTSASAYLLADGVEQSATIGWVMPSAGSITGVSIGGNVTSNSGGTAKLEVMKNGASVFTSDSFATSGTGWKSTQKTQTRGTDTFAAGDVLALKFTYNGGGIAIEKMLATLVVVLD